MADLISDHLTRAYGDLDSARRATRPGMAHFAGTGPEGTPCRLCAWWGPVEYYAASNKEHGPTLKPARCRKYTELMRGEKGRPLPHNTLSCKHFTERDSEVPITDPKANR